MLKLKHIYLYNINLISGTLFLKHSIQNIGFQTIKYTQYKKVKILEVLTNFLNLKRIHYAKFQHMYYAKRKLLKLI